MAFWKKIFKSKYTGAEIDAAVGKAGNLPATTSADAGKALVVDEEGKIVAGEAGGNIVFVGITSEESSVVCELTLNEVGAIIESGKQVFFNVNDGESIAPGQIVHEDFGCITFMVNDSMSLLGISTFIFDEEGATGKEMIRNDYTVSLT